jgi:hypothetical protein
MRTWPEKYSGGPFVEGSEPLRTSFINVSSKMAAIIRPDELPR